jgi:hypothetical protein
MKDRTPCTHLQRVHVSSISYILLLKEMDGQQSIKVAPHNISKLDTGMSPPVSKAESPITKTAPAHITQQHKEKIHHYSWQAALPSL